MKCTLASGLIAGVAVMTLASPAMADPRPSPDEPPATLSCIDGSSYDITLTRGGGDWTPGFDVNGTTVGIPVAFQGFGGEVYSVETGDLLASFSEDEGTTKVLHHRGRGIVECTYASTFISPDDPEFGEDVRIEASGGVSVMFTP